MMINSCLVMNGNTVPVYQTFAEAEIKDCRETTTNHFEGNEAFWKSLVISISSSTMLTIVWLFDIVKL